MTDRQLNSFEKGLNMDTHPRRIQEGQYIDALNGRLDSLDGNAWQWNNIEGTKPVFELPGVEGFPFPSSEKLYIVGGESFDNLLFVAYTNGNDRHGIAVWVEKSIKEYVIKRETVLGALSQTNWQNITQADVNTSSANGVMIPIIENPCFNFNLEHYIGDFRVEVQFDGSLTLYWTDDYNRPRRWNTNTDYYDCKQFDLYLQFKMPVIKSPALDEFIIPGGQLLTGGYRVAVRYVNSDFNSTDWSYLSSLIVITDSTDRSRWWKYDGSVGGQNSGKSFQVDISNLDTTYPYLQIGAVHYDGSIGVGHLTHLYNIQGVTGTYRALVDGNWNGDFDANEVGIDTVKYDKAKTLEIINNKLFLGNLSKNLLDTQLFKNVADHIRLEVRLDDSVVQGETRVERNWLEYYQNPNPPFNTIGDQNGWSPNINGWGHYQNEWMVFNKTNYWSSNSYGFGIQFVMKNGEKSRVYPIGNWYANDLSNPVVQAAMDSDFILVPQPGKTGSSLFDATNLLFKIDHSPFVNYSGDFIDVVLRYIKFNWVEVPANLQSQIDSLIEGYCIVRTDRFGERTVCEGVLLESFESCTYEKTEWTFSNPPAPDRTVIIDGGCPNENLTLPLIDISNNVLRSRGFELLSNPIPNMKFFSPFLQYENILYNASYKLTKYYNNSWLRANQTYQGKGTISPAYLYSDEDNFMINPSKSCVGSFAIDRKMPPSLIYNIKSNYLADEFVVDFPFSNGSQNNYFAEQQNITLWTPGGNLAEGSPTNNCAYTLPFFVRFCSTFTIEGLPDNVRMGTTIPLFVDLRETKPAPTFANRQYYVVRFVAQSEPDYLNPSAYEGDSYICDPFYRFMTKSNTGESNNSPVLGNNVANPFFVCILGIWHQSTLNLNFRNTLLRETEVDSFYFPYSERFSFNTEPGGSSPWYGAMNGYFDAWHVPRENTESLEYNNGYSAQNNLQLQLPEALGERIISELPTRIAYSNQKPNDSFTDWYRVFDAGSYKDEELKYGEITRLVRHQAQLLCVQRQGIVFLAVDQPVQTTDPVSGLIKFGDPQTLPPRGVYITQEYGSQHQWSIAGSTIAIYGFDARKSLLWRVAGTQFEKLSTIHNIDSLFQQFTQANPLLELEDRPLYYGPRPENNDIHYGQYSVSGIYDDLFDEYYLSLKAVKREEENPNAFTIVFGEQQNAFIGFYFGKKNLGLLNELQVNPEVYLKMGNRTFAYTPRTMFLSKENQNQIWELNKGERGKFFFDSGNTTIFPTLITMVSNKSMDAVKVFDALEFEALIKDEFGNDIEVVNPDQLALAFNTSFQYNTQKYLVQGRTGIGNLKRVERAFQTFVPRDEKTGIRPMPRLRDFYLVYTLLFGNQRNEKFLLDHAFIYFRMSQFKAGS